MTVPIDSATPPAAATATASATNAPPPPVECWWTTPAGVSVGSLGTASQPGTGSPST